MSLATAAAAPGRRALFGTTALRGILRSPRISSSLVAGLIMIALVVLLSLFGPRLVNARVLGRLDSIFSHAPDYHGVLSNPGDFRGRHTTHGGRIHDR